MKKFEKPDIRIIEFSPVEIITSSSGDNCDQGMENLGFVCNGGHEVTCTNAFSTSM